MMHKKTLTLSLVVVLASPMAKSSEEYEKKLHNIYKSSYSEEMSDQTWANYIRGIKSRTYQVREGDTLWDLSKVFFGDGLFWSKIWSYNEKLTNPHLITVGQDIQFYTGSVEEAPSIQLGGEEDITTSPNEPSTKDLPLGFEEVPKEGEKNAETAAPQQSQKVVTVPPPSGLYPGAPSLPPPREFLKPVLLNIPSAFMDSETFDASKYDSKGMSFDLRPPIRVNPLFVAHSFLYGRDAKHYPRLGQILEAEDKNQLIGANQFVYIKSDEKFDDGEKLTVMGRGYHFDRNGFTGDVIEYQGTVQIEQYVKDKIYRALVLKSLSGLKGAPWVTREEIPSMDDDYNGRPNKVRLPVIGGGVDNMTRIYGQSDVVYLGGGTRQGVRKGDILGIYKRRDIRYKDVYVDKNPNPIAHVKVFRAEPETSSAFVINSEEVIVPGDESGVPTMISAQSSVTEKKDLNDIESGLDFNSETMVPGASMEKADSSSQEEEISGIE